MTNLFTNLLKMLGLIKQDKPAHGEKNDASRRKNPERVSRNPHADGGCCGSCGGQDQEKKQSKQ